MIATPIRWLMAYTLVLLALLVGLQVLVNGPQLEDLDFDTESAFVIASGLIPENRPHPTGSAENRQVKARIEAELRDSGYTVSSQNEVLCTDFSPGCSVVENIIAIKPGTQAGKDAILLTAHYDSVPGAPGAGDDIAGVAALLQVARELANEAPLRNDVIFLIADAEETGLRGAMAFTEHNPLMQRVKLVVNLEARGASGPSALFETSEGNASLVGLFADGASRPVGTSLMYEVYRHMPNNTDLTIYKKAGAMGMNFAFSRSASLYHSSRDDLQHLSQQSLGHHGDNVLQFVRQVGAVDLASLKTTSNASHLDVFGVYMLSWPSKANLPAALGVLVLLLAIGLKGKTLTTAAIWRSWLALIVLLVLHLAAGWLLSFPLGKWPGGHPLDHPQPLPGNLALLACSIFLVLLIGAWQSKRVEIRSQLLATWLLFSLLAAVLAWLMPGAAYILLLPAVVFAVAFSVEHLLRPAHYPAVAAWLGCIAAAWMAIYHFIFLDVLSIFQAAYLKTAMLGLGAMVAMPLAARSCGSLPVHRALLASLALTLLLTILGYMAPTYTVDKPRSVNVAYQQIKHSGSAAGTSPSSLWRIFTFGPADSEFVADAGFPDQLEEFKRYGIGKSKAHMLPAPELELPAPKLEIESDTTEGDIRSIRGTVHAGRTGFMLGLSFPPESPLLQLSTFGKTIIKADNYKPEKGALASFVGFNDSPVKFELQMKAGSKFDVIAFELSAFPDNKAGQEIIAKRPDNAASIHYSDHTEVQHHYHF